ncbi:hypothetical protein QUF74_12740 [Candidatus Halobeggiatoa sp. HSG11]|nr:hypothetical protein [Candidatus Halobeggiatoa sp. HSG11]
MQPYKKNSLLAGLSKIKISKWPLFITYNVNNFAIKGHHTREILKLVKPGDILIRSFNNYPNNNLVPGTFKHVGFYLSEVNDSHLKKFADIEQHDFKLGRQTVIHAIGGQVILEDLIDFCRCDALAIMRFPRKMKLLREVPSSLEEYFANPTASPTVSSTTDTEKKSKISDLLAKVKRKKNTQEDEPDEKVEEKTEEEVDTTAIALAKTENDIIQHLKSGKVIEFEKIFKILYRIAMKELNTIRKHNLNIEPFYGTASTDLVYFITKSVAWNYGIVPEISTVLLKKQSVILPDEFVDSDLEEIWKKV